MRLNKFQFTLISAFKTRTDLRMVLESGLHAGPVTEPAKKAKKADDENKNKMFSDGR